MSASLPSLPSLALRVAVIRRQAQVLITSLAQTTVQRAFNQLEWDENLHPRGAHGRFIGTGGMQAEREAHHLEHAMKAFERKMSGMSEAERQRAEAALTWRGHTGKHAILAHHSALRHAADAAARALLHDTESLHELRLLRNEYHLRLAQDTLPDASRQRLQREIAVMDRLLARANIATSGPARVPDEEARAIRRQIDQGLKQETPPPTQTTTTHHGPLATGAIPIETTDALGVSPPTAEELAAMRERGGTQATYAREWAQFRLRLQREPRSAIGDGAYLAPRPHVTDRGAAADTERERRSESALYRTLMEQGEVTFTNRYGQTLTLRRRWNLTRQQVVYDLFVGNNTKPASGYANLMQGEGRGRWSADNIFAFLHEQSA